MLATPYVHNYDLLCLALVAVWMMAEPEADDGARALRLACCGLLVFSPILIPSFAFLTGSPIGWLLLVPAFAFLAGRQMRSAPAPVMA